MKKWIPILLGCQAVLAGAAPTEGVILLHGLCRSTASMKKMERALTDAGYAVVNQGYRSREAGVEELSDEAVTTALSDQRLARCERIHFVTHSLGGILVRSYLSRHDEERLGRVVMLGPPNQGSEVVDAIGHWWAFRAVNGPAGTELGTGPESTPNQLGPVDFELGVVAGDRSINWINSVMISGPDDGKVSLERADVEGMKERVVVHGTHPYLMKKQKVIGLTLRFLESGSFSRKDAEG